MHQWMVDNWWATAVETFNFASSNWNNLLLPLMELINLCSHHFSTGATPTEILRSVPKNWSTAQRRVLNTSICQTIIKIIFTSSVKNTGIWLTKTTQDH